MERTWAVRRGDVIVEGRTIEHEQHARRPAATATSAVGRDVTFAQFHATDRDRLVRLLALDLGDVELAAEAVDVAMARAWRRWDRLDRRHDAGAWVYRVARNWATSWYRRRRRIAAAPVPTMGVDDRYPSDHAHVLAAVDALGPDHRAVVVLRHLGGLSTREAAAALGVAEGTVRSRLSRALEQLRADLEAQR